jgi:hypothetical protein
LDKRPKVSPAKKFGSDITWVEFSINMDEVKDVGRNVFSDAMILERIVLFVEVGVRDG